MPTTDTVRRFRLTPGHCLLALLAVEFLLFLSQWFRWLPKGWPVLIAVTAVGVVMLGMFVWFGVAVVLRRRFQFGIRSLLVLTVVVALPFSWLAVEMKRAAKQQAARVAFGRFPGGVMYDYERAGQRTASPARAWLCRVLGDDFFADATFVCLGCDKRFTDADMAYVESLPRLKTLRLFAANITDDGLQHLEVLTDLEELILSRTQVSDAGLEHVQGLTQLRRLDLYATNISDSGLKYLKRLRRLEDLCLSKTNVTDLEYLKQLTQLQHLDLDNTQVTDAGLEPIEGFAKLERLDLCVTKVTDAGITKFQQALPKCKITR